MAQIKTSDLADLDFDTIKNNLKTFFQDQTTFTDYDFEGSGLSLLLDVLAYNTHYNAFMSNMIANEMFLDSAVKRSSAISIAKHLGYTPASARAARALVNVTVNDPADVGGLPPDSVSVPKFTPFSTTINNNAFTFFNITEATITPTGGVYSINGLEIVEGGLQTLNFAVSNPGPDEKFELPDLNIDTSTLQVSVQTSFSNTSTTTYTLTNEITGITSTSKVYYLEVNPQEKFEIFFGDGILGNKLVNGNIVKVQYLRSSGTGTNSSNNAVVNFSTPTLGGSTDIDIVTTQKPSSASNQDSISSIRFKAPRINAARNRAVTANDYKALIEQNFTDAESIIVYGGEENVPPKYGKVLISLKPFDGFNISQSTKNSIITSILRDKKVMAITPEFVDPDFSFVNLILNVVYNRSLTTLSSREISNLVSSEVDRYFSTDLQKFDKDFNKSKLMENIRDINDSIVSVLIFLKIQKRTTVTLNDVNSFAGDDAFKFDNPIQPGTVKSSRFFLTVANTSTLVNFTDVPDTMPPDEDGTGTLVVRDTTTNSILESAAGNVNYGTGQVQIGNFIPNALPNNITDFRITGEVQEEGHNIQAKRNQILVRDKTISDQAAGREAGLTINVTSVQE